MTADTELLKQYVAGSHDAFAELVGRHVNWVFSVACRRVRDEHLAEDVTQAVFILVAQKAGKIREGAAIGPWLLEATRNVSRHALRSRQRRVRHEQAAPPREVGVEEPIAQAQRREIADLLDESLRKLKAADQRALVLRFYQQKSLREIGEELGSNEESARKRVARAIERLRSAINMAGLSIAPAALLEWMEHSAVRSAPAHLTTTSGAAALAGASGSGRAFQIAKGVKRMLMWSKVRVAAVIVLVVLIPAMAGIGVMKKWAAEEEADRPQAAQTPAVDPALAHYIQAKNIMMNMSDDGTKMWGFSMLTGGQWAKATAPQGAKFDPTSCMVATEIGAVQAGNREFGFSPGTGEWSAVDLPDSKRVTVSIADDIAYFQAGDRIFALSGKVGRWDSVQLPPGVQANYVVASGFTMAHVGTHMWAFSAAGGKWREIDVAKGASSPL